MSAAGRPLGSSGSPGHPAGSAYTVPIAARAVIAVMRSVPALFVVSLCALGATWLAGGRATAGLALIATAAGAATFGLRIFVASRIEARSRPGKALSAPQCATAHRPAPSRPPQQP